MEKDRTCKSSLSQRCLPLKHSVTIVSMLNSISSHFFLPLLLLAVVFVYDYLPGAETLGSRHLQGGRRARVLEEDLIWTYIVNWLQPLDQYIHLV